jgi:molybdenum cofactor sulfurtransferase
MIPFSDVSRLAAVDGISLRTGCVCNPGGSAALRGKEVQDQMKELSKLDGVVEVKDVMNGLKNTGVVRLSLGLASNFEDVWRVVNWARGLLDEEKRERDLKRLSHVHSH